MNCSKSQREGGLSQMVTESWSQGPQLAYHPLRVSRSVAQCSLHSLENSLFSNESPTLSTAGGFFSLDDDDTNYLLEDSQAPIMDSTVRSCLCKCGHNPVQVSYPLRSRYFLGSLPDVEEEMIMSCPLSQHGSSTSPLDEEFCYDYPRPENDLEFIYSSPLSLGMNTSAGVPYYSTFTDVNFQRSHLEKKFVSHTSPSRSTLLTRYRDERKALLSTSENYRQIDQEKVGIYSSGGSLDPMYACRNLQYGGIQSPSYEVHFRNGQGILVPSNIRPKQAMSNSPSEVPSSSSVSVSSDETEHPQIKVGLYKTELCRSWEETGFCRYAAKCQFAHGNDDLRPIPRHPKYKTELCRSYTETGLCSYGKRCRFVHSTNTPAQAFPRSRDLEKKSSRRLSIFQQLCGAGEKPPRQA